MTIIDSLKNDCICEGFKSGSSLGNQMSYTIMHYKQRCLELPLNLPI